MSSVTESVVEQAALTWLESLGWQVKHGPEIAPGVLARRSRPVCSLLGVKVAAWCYCATLRRCVAV